MGEKISNIIHSAGSLLDFTGSEGTSKLKSMSATRGIKKHTRGIKRHFDSAYKKI